MVVDSLFYINKKAASNILEEWRFLTSEKKLLTLVRMYDIYNIEYCRLFTVAEEETAL